MIRSRIGNLLTSKCLRKAIETIVNLGILREDGNTVGLPEILEAGDKCRRDIYREDHRRRDQIASNLRTKEENKKEKKEVEPTDVSRPQTKTEKSDLSPDDLQILKTADRKVQVRKSATNESGRDLIPVGRILEIPDAVKKVCTESFKIDGTKKTKSSG